MARQCQRVRVSLRGRGELRVNLHLYLLHIRLFCDRHWRPIKPRGEVYSTEFTEKGWKSLSELGRDVSSPLVPG